jgi:hypothetical protein
LEHEAHVAWSKLLGHSEHRGPYHWWEQWQLQTDGAPLTCVAWPLQGLPVLHTTQVG